MDSSQPIILIVDDEKHTRDGLRRLLENDYDVYVADDIASAMNVLEHEQVDLILTDLRLGAEDGMQFIDRALKMPQPPICIMMTAYGSVDTAVEAMKRVCLLTGASGSLGTAFIERYAATYRIVAVHHRSPVQFATADQRFGYCAARTHTPAPPIDIPVSDTRLRSIENSRSA